MSGARPRIAFYAPMKGPDHPVPSGDRTVARLYVQALTEAGFAVDIASSFRSYDGAGDAARQAMLLAEAALERTRIAARWRISGAPDLWFTYHLYHKAPDLIGPDLTREFGIPYVVAEPSHAPKRATGAWADFYRRAEAGIRAADVVFIATAADSECVTPLRAGKALVRMPPFIDATGWDAAGTALQGRGPLRLIALAMMRAGDKLQSYTLLAEALERVAASGRVVTLDVIGDGPARAAVESAFRRSVGQVHFHGAVMDRTALSRLLAAADLYVWPAVNEAYGMAFLEAQLHGLPVVAGNEGGVADVVRNGETGLLVAPRDAVAFADAILRLIDDADLRTGMGEAARRFVMGERLLPEAARRLGAVLFPLLGRGHA